MARILTTSREALDWVTDEVALRSGVLLSDYDVLALLRGSPLEDWIDGLQDAPDARIGVRPELLADLARALRAAVGNLPDATHGIVIRQRMLREALAMGADVAAIITAMGKVLQGGQRVINKAMQDAIVAESGAPVAAVRKVLLGTAEYLEREPNFARQPTVKPWNTTVPLSQLFEAETLPADPEAYLDQRFIDFLAAQGERLDQIHWRNFERLCAEFFRRKPGLRVALGPGTRDGGVDIRVWQSEGENTVPLLLIQCKRHKRANSVAVEVVKAFWTDVVAEEAEGGLIATTSRITPEGKRVASARQWDLTFAENGRVRRWARSMWTHSWSGKTRTVGLGRYLLPPVRVFQRR